MIEPNERDKTVAEDVMICVYLDDFEHLRSNDVKAEKIIAAYREEIEARLAPAPAQSREDEARPESWEIADEIYNLVDDIRETETDPRYPNALECERPVLSSRQSMERIEAYCRKREAALRSRQSPQAADRTRRCSICGAVITRRGYCAHSAACVDAAEIDPMCEDAAPQPSTQGEDDALEVVRAYIEGCPRKSITDKQARASALKALATLSAVVATAKTETAAIKYAIVQTAGGTIEGRPTNELNYLQRLRELVDTEARLAASAKDDAKMREALAVAGGYVREALDEWDSKYQRHPATEAKRKIIENDLAAVDAALERKEAEK